MPDSLGSWGWWFFTAIILSILVNVISDYIKPKIDLVWERYSTKQRLISEREKEEIDSIVDTILNDPQEIQQVYLKINKWQILRSNYFLLIQVAVMLNLIIVLVAPDGPRADLAFFFFSVLMLAFAVFERNATRNLIRYNNIHLAYRKRIGLRNY